jgi:hypothetical protein
MTIQQLRKDLAGIREAIKLEMPNAVVLFHDKTRKVVRIAGIDVTGCTQEEINKKLKNVSVFLHVPEKEPYPGE